MRHPTATLILLIVVTATAFLSPGRRGLFPTDETKYRSVVREMHSGHSLLVPSLEGRFYSDKPPMHFWMVYGLTKLFGLSSTWPFVLPSLLALVGMLFLIRRLSMELFGGDGWLPALIFATFTLAWGLGQSGRMDMTFTLLITSAVWAVSRFFRNGESREVILAGLFTGLAILVKGPMAFVIVVLIFVIERIRRRRDLPPLPRPAVAAAILLAAAIPMTWLIPALRAGGKAYAYELLVRQNVGRAINPWVHRQPVWWFAQRSPATFFPWILLAVIAIYAIYRSREASSAANEERFCVSWFLSVFVPFSLISGKLDVYMLPALVPVALLCAHFVESARESRSIRLASAANVLFIAAFALLAANVPLVSPLAWHYLPQLKSMAEPLLAGLAWSTVLVAAVALVVLLALSRRSESDQRAHLLRTTVALAAVTIYPEIYFTLFLLPAISALAT